MPLHPICGNHTQYASCARAHRTCRETVGIIRISKADAHVRASLVLHVPFHVVKELPRLFDVLGVLRGVLVLGLSPILLLRTCQVKFLLSPHKYKIAPL